MGEANDIVQLQLLTPGGSASLDAKCRVSIEDICPVATRMPLGELVDHGTDPCFRHEKGRSESVGANLLEAVPLTCPAYGSPSLAVEQDMGVFVGEGKPPPEKMMVDVDGGQDAVFGVDQG